MFGVLFKEKPGVGDRAVQACLDDFPNCTAGRLQVRQGAWKKELYAIREMINYQIYLKPGHPNPSMRTRWKTHFPRLVWRFVSSQSGERLLAKQWMGNLLQKIEKLSVPDAGIALELEDEKPDVVVDVTNLAFKAADVEYQKVIHALKIPLVIAVASWDNLTTKGTFHFLPDAIFLWNQSLVQEAEDIHHIPVERMVVMGAPTFDYLFEGQTQSSREEFCEQTGLDPQRGFVLYLCSSVQVAGDETAFVSDFAAALSMNPATLGIQVLVRPYPMNATIWKGFQRENVVVYPLEGESPDVPATQLNYFHSMMYSRAVVGVNTTAMIEAAILDRPCVTIFTERYKATQMGRGHFHHLVKADFLESANGFEDSTRILARMIVGEDTKAENRRQFVNNFIRPNGAKKPVSILFANAVELAARRVSPQQIKNELLK
jgi:hypothetical protein